MTSIEFGTRLRAAQRLGQWDLCVLLALVALATTIRVLFLGEPMRYDEAYTFEVYATRSVRYIVSTYDVPNNHIFYTLLTHVAWRIFGNHLWTVRAVAFTAGVATVPMSFLVARDLYGRMAGLWAAALVATSAPLVDYSVDGRGYELGTFLVLLQAWLGWRALNRASTRRWIGFAVSAAAAVYTVPTMAFGVVTVGLWMAGVLAVRRDRGDLRVAVRLAIWLAVAGALALLAYSPVLGQEGWSYGSPLPAGALKGFAETIWNNWNRATPSPWQWLVAAGFVVGVVAHRRLSNDRFPLAVAAAVAIALVIAVHEVPPFIRNWTYLVPIYLVTAAGGLSAAFGSLGRRRFSGQLANVAALIVVAVVLAVDVIGSGQQGAEQPPFIENNIAAFLEHHLTRDETVVMEWEMQVPAAYYFNRSGYEPPSFSAHDQRSGRLHVIALLINCRGVSGCPGGELGRSTVTELLREHGASVKPPPRISILARMKFITAYSVRLPPFRAKKMP